MIYLDLRGNWKDIFERFEKEETVDNDYHECLAFSYSIDPLKDYSMSNLNSLFSPEKAKAVYRWYKRMDSKDHSIEDYFDEYKTCTDEAHPDFNSNYGLYAYSDEGLKKCIKRLAKSPNTRQAMFCINNNEAMSDRSIDKLCTNTVQFFIRDNKLKMIVQMRASNMITLLPYDSFMFCYWYLYVFNKLYNEQNMKWLETDKIYINAATIHYYDKNLSHIDIEKNDLSFVNNIESSYKDENFLKDFEMNMILK